MATRLACELSLHEKSRPVLSVTPRVSKKAGDTVVNSEAMPVAFAGAFTLETRSPSPMPPPPAGLDIDTATRDTPGTDCSRSTTCG
jgi:hypothetical protein